MMEIRVMCIIRKLWSQLIVLLSLLGLQAFAASTAELEKLATANTGFTFGLLKEIAKEQPGANVFISPYSASSLLEMVGNGAAGKTRQEMEAVLGITGLQPKSLNESHKDLERSIKTAQTNVTLAIANSIWYRP